MPAKENYLGNGNSPWAKMIRWQREHPGSFYRTYRKRNTVESCFSAIKNRFNFRVRSVTLEMQKRELAIMSICRNLLVQPRIKTIPHIQGDGSGDRAHDSPDPGRVVHLKPKRAGTRTV